jgi:hypothetical protein
MFRISENGGSDAYLRGMMLKNLYLTLLFMIALYSCSQPGEVKKTERRTASYQAIQGADTALLELTTKGSTFKGKCAIRFGSKFTDSGEVKGLIRGDTLLGDFHYLHYGLEWKRVAFALLKEGELLYMGEGDQGEYFNIPYFKPNGPSFDSVKFVFRPIAAAR